MTEVYLYADEKLELIIRIVIGVGIVILLWFLWIWIQNVIIKFFKDDHDNSYTGRRYKGYRY